MTFNERNVVYPDIKAVSRILDEENITHNGMWMGGETFSNVYRYVLRYFERYYISAYKVLITLNFKNENISDEEKSRTIIAFSQVIQSSLRNSDIMVRVSATQIFLVLPEVDNFTIDSVIERITASWKYENGEDDVEIIVETESISSDSSELVNRDRQEWVVIVDDNKANLRIAQMILNKSGIKTTTLQSGDELIDFFEENVPDLILLDIQMPKMDGFETLRKLREKRGTAAKTPVIFLTADEDKKNEIEGFSLGAMDFIRKPFIPEVLTMRVRRAINQIRLTNHLEEEVNDRILENQRLSIHIIQSLAAVIEAKDVYTNGHSDRVAEYSREIAKRYGYSEKETNDIYIMGLLHDVGKIGVPNTIINKPGRLNDEEYQVIKEHPAKGAKILENIKEMNKLANGARWHHERYDGKGYPDGLAGNEIPEEARIIAVADAYDAMTSNRSYRKPLTQEFVKGELLKCKGTQFDPVFADIMIEMIDEDKDFSMRETE